MVLTSTCCRERDRGRERVGGGRGKGMNGVSDEECFPTGRSD